MRDELTRRKQLETELNKNASMQDPYYRKQYEHMQGLHPKKKMPVELIIFILAVLPIIFGIVFSLKLFQP